MYTKKDIIAEIMIAINWLQENNISFWHILRRNGIFNYLSEGKLLRMKKDQLNFISSELVRKMYESEE